MNVCMCMDGLGQGDDVQTVKPQKQRMHELRGEFNCVSDTNVNRWINDAFPIHVVQRQLM